MRISRIRWTALILASTGTLFASTCQAVLETIRLSLAIADTWISL